MTTWESAPFNPKPWCPRCEEPFTTRPGAMSKMTEGREIEICSACGNDEGLGRSYGLNPATVYRIKWGQGWTHVEEAA